MSMFLSMMFQTPRVYLTCCFRAAHAAKVCLPVRGYPGTLHGPWEEPAREVNHKLLPLNAFRLNCST